MGEGGIYVTYVKFHGQGKIPDVTQGRSRDHLYLLIEVQNPMNWTRGRIGETTNLLLRSGGVWMSSSWYLSRTIRF